MKVFNEHISNGFVYLTENDGFFIYLDAESMG